MYLYNRANSKYNKSGRQEDARKEGTAVEAGKKITELRTASGMSQQTLADLLFVSRELVSKWENGTRSPDIPTAEKIAEVFGVPAETIIDPRDTVFGELYECVPGGVEITEGQMTAKLNVFLQSVNARNAGVFLKRYYLLRSVAEIAAEYKKSENHVRSILSKTRKRFRRFLEEDLP